jgi:hypothetical protein
MSDRTEEVLELAMGVVVALEQGRPVSLVALQARRLAELIDDDATYLWRRLECGGIADLGPPDREWKDAPATHRGLKKFFKLRGVPEYTEKTLDAVRQGKLPENARILSGSLAELEAQVTESTKDDPHIAELQRTGAYEAVTLLRLQHSDRVAILGRVRVVLHEWASHIDTTYRFRQIAGNIFDRFKTTTDPVLAKVCPEAVGKLNHAIERASSGSSDDWADAALACRRVLKAFADSVYPARDGLVNGRKVGEAEYKNRLWAFAKEHSRAALDSEFLAEEEIDGLCRGLDKIYELDSKGVHGEVRREEAQQAVLRTYILLSQLAALVPGDLVK